MPPSKEYKRHFRSDKDPSRYAHRHRGGVLLELHGIELHLHPFLGFSLAPRHRSKAINTDDAGFRLSDSPFGTVDSRSWLRDGGGGLVLGNSVTIGLAASSDAETPVSHLAHLTGQRQLNVGICAGNSLQELIAALPFLPKASSVAVIAGGTDLINMIGSRRVDGVFGPVSYERAIEALTGIPMFDLVMLAEGEEPEAPAPRLERPEPPRWSLDDAASRMDEAVANRLRDLGFLVRAAPEGTPVVFCLQPFATTRTRDCVPEELDRYHFEAPVFGMLHHTVEDLWDGYADRLRAGCERLGVHFLDLAARRFAGDSFADNVHLTDNGNRQAAELIRDVLAKAA
ncbi:hypothetical protein AB0J52_29415 [Spirillospora sp. NPDC049652]